MRHQIYLFENATPMSDENPAVFVSKHVKNELSGYPVVVSVVQVSTQQSVYLFPDSELGKGVFGCVKTLAYVPGSTTLSSDLSSLVIKSGSVDELDKRRLQPEVDFFRHVYGGAAKLFVSAPYEKSDGSQSGDEEPVLNWKYKMVFKKVPGERLFSYIEKNQGTLNKTQKLKILLAVVTALQNLHRQHKIIHGDFSTKNIHIEKIGDSFKAYLLDFGWSYNIPGNATVTEISCDYWTTDRLNKRINSQPVAAHPYQDLFSLAYWFRIQHGWRFNFLSDIQTVFLQRRITTTQQLIDIVNVRLGKSPGCFPLPGTVDPSLPEQKSHSPCNAIVQTHRMKALHSALPVIASEPTDTVLPSSAVEPELNTETPAPPHFTPVVKQPTGDHYTRCAGKYALGSLLLGGGGSATLFLLGVCAIANPFGWVPLAVGVIIAVGFMINKFCFSPYRDGQTLFSKAGSNYGSPYPSRVSVLTQ